MSRFTKMMNGGERKGAKKTKILNERNNNNFSKISPPNRSAYLSLDHAPVIPVQNKREENAKCVAWNTLEQSNNY